MKCVHIFYSGSVQGVGFRYTVQRYATKLNLKGWVKNLSDWRVEVMIEGPNEGIEEFCNDIKKYFNTDINFVEINFEEYKDQFDSFDIHFES